MAAPGRAARLGRGGLGAEPCTPPASRGPEWLLALRDPASFPKAKISSYFQLLPFHAEHHPRKLLAQAEVRGWGGGEERILQKTLGHPSRDWRVGGAAEDRGGEAKARG